MSNAAVFLGGADVEVAAAGALSGDGAIGDPLKVNVDGVTITVNGSNELVGSSITVADTRVLFADGANNPAGDADFTWNKTDNLLTVGDALTITSSASGQAGTIQTPNVTGTTIGSELSLYAGNAADGFGARATIHGSNVASFNGAILSLEAGTALTAGTATLSGSGITLSADTIRFSEYLTSSVAFQVYDFEAGWKTFLTTTAGSTPNVTLATPSGGTMTVQASTFKSSDGTAGASAGPFTVITGITVKNGLVTTLTGS